MTKKSHQKITKKFLALFLIKNLYNILKFLQNSRKQVGLLCCSQSSKLRKTPRLMLHRMKCSSCYCLCCSRYLKNKNIVCFSNLIFNPQKRTRWANSKTRFASTKTKKTYNSRPTTTNFDTGKHAILTERLTNPIMRDNSCAFLSCWSCLGTFAWIQRYK